MISNFKNNSKEQGFALLMTLIVVSVVISVGLSLLDLSIKQLALSTNAKDSEIAFHAANAGAECARYTRREDQEGSNMTIGDPIDPSCFGASPDTNTRDNPNAPVLDNTNDTEATIYSYSFTWGEGNDRCTRINMLVASSSFNGNGGTVTNMTTLVPGYPDGNNKACEAGSQCTVLSVRGYNKPCNAVGGYGTVEREVLIQF